jgi:hypothetical protein
MVVVLVEVTTAALSTIWPELDRMGLTVKKSVHATERRRPDVAARAAPVEPGRCPAPRGAVRVSSTNPA